MENSNTWHTCDEMEYLEHIGTHTVLGRSSLTRRELLENYQRAMKFRPRSEGYLDFGKLSRRVEELLADA